MRFVTALIALAASSAVLAKDAPPSTLMSLPNYGEPARAWANVDEPAARQRCRDRIEQARAASGKPELDKTPAGVDEPLLHYAVDHRVDGCGVLVPVGDPADLRQSPEPGPPIVIPAASGQ